MNIQDMLQEAAMAFTRACLSGPRLDAEVLLAHCLKKDRVFLYTNKDCALTDDQVRDYRACVARRVLEEPVAYIVGYKEFWSLPLQVDSRVLIPRPDTEVLVEEALKIASASDNVIDKILDVGVGSGAISIALALELQNKHLFAVDVSPGAIAVAGDNARKFGIEDRISFVIGDLVKPFAGMFDMIVSNPPYIAADDFACLPQGVRSFEPHSSLLGGPEGLTFHDELIRAGEARLRVGGWLLMEIGAGQQGRIEDMLRMSCLYDNIRFRSDYAGINRVAIARRH
jgi:release factor glutamine methyltransferase